MDYVISNVMLQQSNIMLFVMVILHWKQATSSDKTLVQVPLVFKFSENNDPDNYVNLRFFIFFLVTVQLT